MKILDNGIKVRDLKIHLDNQTISIIYEKGIYVKTLIISFEFAKEINFINFEKLNKIL
jgi:hypothetical protein